MNRRSFLQSSALTAAALAFSRVSAAWPGIQEGRGLGLQLYTLRDLLKEKPEKVLAEVSGIGYRYVEGYTTEKGMFFGLEAKEFKALLDQYNLSMPSIHIGFLGKYGESTWALNGDTKAVAEAAKAVGIETLICPSIPGKWQKSDEGWGTVIKHLSEAQKTFATSGLNIAYHNHAFEFESWEPSGAATGFAYLTKLAQKKVISLELDLYWAVRAGKNPLELLAQLPEAFTHLHVKDLGKDQATVPVGTGTIPFAEILPKFISMSNPYLFVEQDQCQEPPLESVALSFKNLQGITKN